MVTISALIFCPVDYQVVINIKIMNRILSAFLGLAIMLTPFAVTTPAVAATFTLGNDSSSRPVVDTYTNFTIVDTNNSATAEGEIYSFGYYAANKNPFHFVVVDSANKVKYVSAEITPASVGSHSLTLPTPVSVSVGDNIGMHFVLTGTIPFVYSGSPAIYTPNNNSLPVEGNTLNQEGTSGRTYSLVANGETVCVAAPAVYVSDTATQVDGNDAVVVTPHPSWTTIDGASWVWNQATDGSGSHPVGTKVLTRTFVITGTPLDSSLKLSADNGYSVSVNSTVVGSDAYEQNWSSVDTVTIPASVLVSGSNTITFTVENYNAPDGYTGPNPAGLIYELTINSECEEIVSDPEIRLPGDKKECMKGGWMDLTDDNGTSFKNQGDCVSFVATGGKNKAAGN